jgi:hypothetical protein
LDFEGGFGLMQSVQMNLSIFKFNWSNYS